MTSYQPFSSMNGTHTLCWSWQFNWQFNSALSSLNMLWGWPIQHPLLGSKRLFFPSYLYYTFMNCYLKRLPPTNTAKGNVVPKIYLDILMILPYTHMEELWNKVKLILSKQKYSIICKPLHHNCQDLTLTF